MEKSRIISGLVAILVLTVLLAGCNGGNITTSPPTTTPATTTPATTQMQTTKLTTSNSSSTAPTTPTAPTFELKELHSGISTPADSFSGPYKKFFFTYLTNQDELYMKFIGPDGYFRKPFSIKGPGEQMDEAQIPAQDVLDTQDEFPRDAGYVALPGTYKMVVYSSLYPKTVILWEKDFTYQGAKLTIEEASINKWSYVWSWPVIQFFVSEISITVSNKGDLPSYASVWVSLDKKWILFGLGYVDANATRTFSLLSNKNAFFDLDPDRITYKNPGDTVQPTSHNLSFKLVSRIPTSSEVTETLNAPAASTLTEYYNSTKCPYKKVSLSTDPYSEASDFLLLDEYSATVETPKVITKE